MKQFKFQRGIALVQILLITGILTVFALYLNQEAQQQIKTALLAQQRTDAEILLRDTKSIVFNELMVKQRHTPAIKNPDFSAPFSERWNFYGQAIQLNDNVTITMQDHAGLMSLHLPPLERLKQLLLSNGVNYERTEKITAHLLDWQDVDNIPRSLGQESNFDKLVRNANLQTVRELEQVIRLSELEQGLLFTNTTVFYNGDFNPFHASKELIAALSNEESAIRVMELRSLGQLSISDFSAITGIVADDVSYLPVNTLTLVISVNVGEVELAESLVVRLNPYAVNKQVPIKVLAQRRI